MRGALTLVPQATPVALDIRIDPALLLFTTAIGVAASLFFGIVPAWQVLPTGRLEPLKEGGRSGTAGLARQRLRSTPVTAEVALTLILLVGAGLFLSVSLPITQYEGDAKQMTFYRAVLERLSAIGGVTSAAAGMPLPFSGNNGSASFHIEGRPSPSDRVMVLNMDPRLRNISCTRSSEAIRRSLASGSQARGSEVAKRVV